VIGIVLILFGSLSFLGGPLNSSHEYPNWQMVPNYGELRRSESVENITVIFEDGELNITLGMGFISVLEGETTAFNATSFVLGGLANIDYYDTFNGVFVRGMRINGTWYQQTSTKYWLYYVNGVLAPVSCSKYTLQSNDTVRWVFSIYSPPSDSNYQDFTREITIFFIGLSLIIAGFIGVGVILKRRERKKFHDSISATIK